jgi:FkbM family methyltransferase
LLPHILDGIPEVEKFRACLPTMEGLLRNAAANGFQPRTIIDIGANVGDWSRMASAVFPSSYILMVDGNPENEVHLEHTKMDLSCESDYAIIVLGPEDKSEVVFHIVGAGSGVLPELTTFQKSQLKLPMGTLDGLVARSPKCRLADSRVLMKLDVQGFEVEVLRGGQKVLQAAELVILETSLLPYNDGGALFSEVVQFMAAHGLAVFDFCGQFRRQTDNTLFQTDVAFAKFDSELRKPRKFWRNEP